MDAHLFHGNDLGIDIHNITWRRVVDINDRALRNITVGLGGRLDGIPRESGFDITAASEVMAALALATSLQDLRNKMGAIVVGYTKDDKPVTAEDLEVAGSMTVMLREAIKPNLMQTLEGTPALVHTGPFGNIATGNSSIVADQIGIKTGDFLLTEAGFGADMGAERQYQCRFRASFRTPLSCATGVVSDSGKHRIAWRGAHCPQPSLRKPRRSSRWRGHQKAAREHEDSWRNARRGINDFQDNTGDLQAIEQIAQSMALDRPRTHFSNGGAGAAEPHLLSTMPFGTAPSLLSMAMISRCEKDRNRRASVDGAEDVSFSVPANKQLDSYEPMALGSYRFA